MDTRRGDVAEPFYVKQGFRLVGVRAGLATRLRPEEGFQLPSGSVVRWRQARAESEKRREARRQQRRFDRAPVTYRQPLEELAIN